MMYNCNLIILNQLKKNIILSDGKRMEIRNNRVYPILDICCIGFCLFGSQTWSRIIYSIWNIFLDNIK